MAPVIQAVTTAALSLAAVFPSTSAFSAPCEAALLPFENAATVAQPDPFFSCFTCTPLPFLPTGGRRGCDEGDDPEINATVTCSAECQTMIDDVQVACAGEEDFVFFDALKLIQTFFFSWGTCDFGYTLSACDAALLDFYSTIEDVNNIDACNRFTVTSPGTCASVCETAIVDLLETCDGQEFLVRRNGDEELLTTGTVATFSPNSDEIKDSIWAFLSPVCEDLALDLVEPSNGNTPAPKSDDETNIGVIAGGAAAGGLAIGLAIVGYHLYSRKKALGSSGDDEIPEAKAVGKATPPSTKQQAEVVEVETKPMLADDEF